MAVTFKVILRDIEREFKKVTLHQIMNVINIAHGIKNCILNIIEKYYCT